MSSTFLVSPSYNITKHVNQWSVWQLRGGIFGFFRERRHVGHFETQEAAVATARHLITPNQEFIRKCD